MIAYTEDNPYLDVSQLEPPEPMTAILDAVEILEPEKFLHVYHRREPFPLYKVLDDMNMKWQTHCDNNGMYHIYIWPDADKAAEEKVMALNREY